MSGRLCIVATPIGNLEDMTLRAIRTLKETDIIACEDTRRASILLGHYGIRKKLVSFYSYNQVKRLDQILSELKNGKNIALISDSGTPGISDPGTVLIKAAIDDGIPVESIPGPSAFVSALVCSGLPTNGFVFLGFLPRKESKIKKLLVSCSGMEKTIIFYESPHRIAKTLETCRNVFGGKTRCVIAREITKKFEEYIRGNLKDICDNLSGYVIKGEFVVMISPDETGQ